MVWEIDTFLIVSCLSLNEKKIYTSAYCRVLITYKDIFGLHIRARDERTYKTHEALLKT